MLNPKIYKISRIVVCIALLFLSPFLSAKEPSQIDFIEALSMNNAIESVSVTPDGKTIAMIHRTKTRLPETIITLYDPANPAKTVRLGAIDKLQIRRAFWVNNDRLLVVFSQDSDFLEDLTGYTRIATKIATIDKKGKKWVTLPQKRVDRRSKAERRIGQFINASLVSFLPGDKNHILLRYPPKLRVAANFYKVNVNTGAAKLVHKNIPNKDGFILDYDHEIRLASSITASKFKILARLKGSKKWQTISTTDITSDAVVTIFEPLGFFNPDDANEILVASNHEKNTVGIYSFDLKTRKFKDLKFHHPQYDASGVWAKRNNKTHIPKVLGYTYVGKNYTVFWDSPEMESLMSAINSSIPGRTNRIIDYSADMSVIIIHSGGDRYPSEYYLLKDKETIEFLGSSRPFIKPEQFSPTNWVYYKTRDGRKTRALVTTPINGKAPFPTVVMPHGGPISRDSWGFDPWVQLLAYHGYQVIQPQFRGSQGFGQEHLKAGFGKWGLEMQDDIEDATQHLIKNGTADANRLAIFGWSYGGYAAFVGSYRDPNPFKCAIAGAGVSDIKKLRADLRKGGSIADKIYSNIHDGDNPLDHVSSVDIPILVIHGTNDERVLIEHSNKFVKQLKKYKKKHSYLRLDGANHFFGTIYYQHFKQMYPAMIDWLDNTCNLKASL